ncbi:outer membrane beta-barrel protein [Larkinella terrae]|uniref:Outer membrane beta-barrel protein n=1 Tax=Larkinella terrae TaxID=2025311 RepID=A0A7K0EUG7_9BACT|nr:outer membrane beta-barrel protein [Larkinella terrae]MRS65216.1 outer membrane beta-barrel protein [Larkinella terrae]
MTKSLLLAFFALMTLSASAQDFKPFKVNVSLGFARPAGSGAAGGLLVSLEPKYGLMDNLDLGLRIELAAMARSISVNNQNGDVSAKGMGSYLLTGTYYLSKNNFRPYVGLGAGLYSIAGTTVTVVNGQVQDDHDDYKVEASNKFGVMARVGFKAGHFNLGVEYNIVPNSKSDILGQQIDSKNAYLGVKIGVDIGGGRK